MAPATDSIEPLVGSWQLAAAAPAGCSVPTITFQRDGTVTGNSGINRFRGSIDVAALSASNFRLGPVVATRMAGPPEAMQFETAFLQAVATADAAFTCGNSLVLKQGDHCLLEFTRAAAG